MRIGILTLFIGAGLINSAFIVSSDAVIPTGSTETSSRATYNKTAKVNEAVTKGKKQSADMPYYRDLAAKLGVTIRLTFAPGVSEEAMAKAYETAYKKAVAGAISSFINDPKRSGSEIIAFGNTLGLSVNVNMLPGTSEEERHNATVNAHKKALQGTVDNLLASIPGATGKGPIKGLKGGYTPDYRTNLDAKTEKAVSALIVKYTAKSGNINYSALAKALTKKNNPALAAAVMKKLISEVRAYVQGPDGFVSEKMTLHTAHAEALIKAIARADKKGYFLSSVQGNLAREMTAGKGNDLTLLLKDLIKKITGYDVQIMVN